PRSWSRTCSPSRLAVLPLLRAKTRYRARIACVCAQPRVSLPPEVAVELRGVTPAQGVSLPQKPVVQPALPPRRLAGNEQLGHQALDLLAGQDPIAHEQAEDGAAQYHHRRRQVQERRPAVDRDGDLVA